MEFIRATNETCINARATVVVIDVLRAFTTTAYALDSGVNSIILVDSSEEAFALRAKYPGVMLIGESKGKKIIGFDFNNSPTNLLGRVFDDQIMIQCTSNGTKGVVRSGQAKNILVSSFVCAKATARKIIDLKPQNVTFVLTGYNEVEGGDEDAACADYIEALISLDPANNQQINPDSFIQRVRNSYLGRVLAESSTLDLPATDLDYCIQVDRFNFSMVVHKENGQFTLKPEREKGILE